MKKKVGLVLLPVLLLAAIYGAWHWWSVARHRQSTDNAYVEADISVISPRIEGYVAAVSVADNQRVRTGDLLLTIDDRDFRARAEQAAAQLAVQEAAIANIESRLQLAHSLIRKAEADVASARAELTRATADLTRYGQLASRDFVSQQRLATARADAEKATAALRRAEAALAAEQDQIGVLETQRGQQDAAIRQARAAAELAASDLEKTVIRAPIDGVVGNSGARVGQLVRPGTQLMSLVPVAQSYVTANFKETQLRRLRVGQKAILTVDAYPDVEIEGRVESVSPASGAQFSLLPPENATGNFTKIVQRVPVRIALPQEGPLAGLLRPGLSAVVTVDTRDEGVRGLAELPGGDAAQLAARPAGAAK
ncbi:MAG TPA: HlyD family secretion protein [Azospirillaceae bacterium]|nr:HlyD family secretion protein [Azospirillaceae bacterium]